MNHTLALADIRIDGGTQSRGEIDGQIVADYFDALVAGAEFPPCDVFYDGREYWLADGFHRRAAYEKAKRPTLPVTVHEGTQRDAILFSVGANATHGLRRSNADKRRAVTLLLTDSEWVQWSDREIARRCGVGHQLVAHVRSEMVQLDESSSSRDQQKRLGADGKSRKLPERQPDTEANGPEPDENPEPWIADADDDPPIPPERPLSSEAIGRWGDFEMNDAVARIVRKCVDFGADIEREFAAADATRRAEFAERAEPSILRLFEKLHALLPVTARRAQDNRAQMRVIDGGK